MSRTYPYDVILLLGCGINPDGSLIDDAIDSTEHAVWIYKERMAPRIIVSGSLSYKASFQAPITEAAGMKKLAVELGVPENDVLLEEESKDTLGNIYFTKKRYLESNNWKNVAIIIGPNHSVERIVYILQKVLGPDYTYKILNPHKTLAQEVKREQASLKTLKEWLEPIADGNDQKIYNLMKTHHPGYSKNPKYSIEELQRRFEGSV